MKRFFGILNLLLCFEFIVGPAAPQLSLLTVGESYAQESCPAGTAFNSTLNRCLTTEQTTSIMNAVSNCSSGDKACYKANAEEALKKAEEDGKVDKELKNKGGLLGSGMKAAAVAVPLFMAASMLFKGNKNPKTCPSVALYMMLAGGAAVFIGDMWANKQHKSRLKKIRKEWETKIQPKDTDTNSANGNVTVTQNAASSEDQKAKATEAQSEAFEMLAKSEDSLASAAKFKSGVYGVATLAFGGAAVISMMEAMKPSKPCKNAAGTKPATIQDAEGAAGGAPAPVTPPASTPDIPNNDSGPINAPGTPFHDTVFNDIDLHLLLNTDVLKAQQNLISSSDSTLDLLTIHYAFEESLARRSSPTLEEYESNKRFILGSGIEDKKEVFELAKTVTLKIVNELNPISELHAETPAAAASAPMKMLGKVNHFLSQPITRAAISGVFAVWSGIMTMHARKQAKVSEERAKYLRSVKDTFNNATGAISCSSQERSNSANPRCYCYTPEGQRNSARSSSAICTALFSGKTPPSATNYLSGVTTNQKVCITSAGIDENCACRSNNSCLSAIPNNFSGINPGSLSMLSSGLAPFGQVTSGQLAAASVNGASATANAMKMVDAARNMASKDPGLLASLDKSMKNGAAELTAASSGGSAPSLGDSSAMPMNMSASQAAEMLEKELKKSESEINSVSGAGTFAAPGSSANENLEFGMTADQLAGDQTALAEVMDQKMDYGQNDINSKSDTNLFEVLSNRYQRSGMRRLFDEDGKVQADKPNKSDVNP